MRRISFEDMVSIFSGLVGGMLGVGGSFIYVPTAAKLCRRPLKLVHAEASVLVLSSSICSSIVYLHGAPENRFNWVIVSILAAFSMIGSVIGVKSWSKMNGMAMRLMFGLLLIAMAAITVCMPWFPKWNFSDVLLIVVGLSVGFIGGILGVGGGTIIVPVLMLGYGVTQMSAQGMSLAVMVPMALSSTFSHIWFRHLDIRRLPHIVVFAGVGGVFGSLLASRLPPTDLRWLFIISLSLIGSNHLRKSLVKSRSPQINLVSG